MEACGLLRAVGVFVFAVLVTYGSLPPRLASAANRDVCASCTYTTLDDALLAAQDGDVIRIAAGTYNSGFSIQGTRDLEIRGGYNSNFAARSPSTTPSIITSVAVTYHSGSVVLDGLTIDGSGANGVYVSSSNTDITINDCRILNSTSAAISLYDVSDAVISNNTITGGGNSYGAVDITTGWGAHSQVTISGNTVTGQVCDYCYGVFVGQAKSADVIENNVITDNTNGINLQFLNSSQTPLVEGNVIANQLVGLYIVGGSATVDHNILRDNSLSGMHVIASSAVKLRNNVFARNGKGVHFDGNNGTPEIRNNIFYEQSNHALDISGTGGWGATSTVPTAVNYNCFFQNHSSLIIHSSLTPGSYTDETPDSYSDINGPVWASGNFKEDPKFVDADNNDFSLAANSFLIDEGDPTSDYADEPATNGSRINVGHLGNTSAAAVSTGSPAVSNVSASKSGSDILVTFDTNTAVSALWLTLEYWNGSSYTTVGSDKISGTGYTAGYRTGRITAGASRSVRIVNVASALGTSVLTNSKIRVTVEHAADTAQAESGTFSGTFTPPTVSIDSPGPGEVLTSSQPTILASAADGDGLTGVSFYYKRNSDPTFILLNTDTTAPYTASWGGTSLTPGESYDFQAVATDIYDNTASSELYAANFCDFSLTSNSTSSSASGSSGTINLNVSPSGCSWTAASNVGWIMSSDAGSGSRGISYSVQPNMSSIARTGTVTIAGKTFTVNQSGASCTYLLSKSSHEFENVAGETTVTITPTPADCAWNISSSATWLTFSSISGQGTEEVTLGASANSETTARDTSVTIAGQSLSISQKGAPPPPTPDPNEPPADSDPGDDPAPEPEPEPEPDPSMSTLTVNVAGDGVVKLSSRGESCGTGCYMFKANKLKPKTIELEAKPGKNSLFSSWFGACKGKKTICVLKLKRDTTVTARFVSKKARRRNR